MINLSMVAIFASILPVLPKLLLIEKFYLAK